MPVWLLRTLDIAFVVFHTALVLFNLLGWISPKTRRWHLLSIGLTLGSWIVMGFWYGFGYCVCTDLHWQVKEALGEPADSPAYMQFLFRALGLDLEMAAVEAITVTGFGFGILMSLITNLRDLKRPQGSAKPNPSPS